MIALGFDPGFAHLGIGAVDGRRARFIHTVNTSTDDSDAYRFQVLRMEIVRVIIELKPSAIGVEDITGARQGGFQRRNSSKAEHIRRVVGIIEGAAAHAGIPFFEHTPHKWRSTAGVQQGASAAQEARIITQLTGATPSMSRTGRISGHAVAALGLAVTTERQMRIGGWQPQRPGTGNPKRKRGGRRAA